MTDNVQSGLVSWFANGRKSLDATRDEPIDGGGGGTLPPDMDIHGWRLDQHDKQFDRIDGKLDAVASSLADIKALVAGLSTKGDLRSQTLTIVGAVLASLLAVAALFLAASGNQLSAFQAGLTAVQTKISVQPPAK